MKQIPLTRGMFALVDDDMYDILIKWKWCADKHGKPGRHRYYAYRTSPRDKDGKIKKIYMHREVLFLTNEKCDTDHIDHNGLNNQRDNLRTCTRSQNNMNISYGRGKSKYKGVSWSTAANGWTVKVAGKYVGYFKNEIKAAMAYNKAANTHYGEYASLNKIT